MAVDYNRARALAIKMIGENDNSDDKEADDGEDADSGEDEDKE